MTAPTTALRIDWANVGSFGNTPYDTVTPLCDDSNVVTLTRGRSADFSQEAIGSFSFVLDNDNDAYTPDRQWHDNPSFEVNTAGWATNAIASLTAAATSITKVTDNAGQGGTSAGEAVLTSTSNSGVTFAIPYPFLNGIAYSVSVWLKSTAGTLNVRAGMASAGTPADIQSSSGNITTSWAQYSFTWTPSADRADGVFFVRTNTTATATVRIDAIQVNAGSTLNTYIEAPSRGQLSPGRPVHFYATYSAVDYPKFYGFIERLSPDPEARTVTVTCYDMLRRFAETDVFPIPSIVTKSAREIRTDLLGGFERGNRNLVLNPSFVTNTSGWSTTAGTLTRLTTDSPPNGQTTCGQFAAAGVGNELTYEATLQPLFPDGEAYQVSVYLRCTSGTQTWTFGAYSPPNIDAFIDPAPSISITVTTVWQRFSISITTDGSVPAAGGAVGIALSSTAADTLRIGDAMVTRGQALYPFSLTGTGRWPNFYRGGSFDGDDVTDWVNAWHNYITNGSFTTNTTGWSVAGDAFTLAGTSITRTTSDAKYGTASGRFSAAAFGSGIFYAITGTFTSGLPVKASVWLKAVTGSSTQTEVGIGSQGTPADKASATLISVTATDWRKVEVTWTPSSTRTDAHLYIITDNFGGGGAPDFYIDGAMVLTGITQTTGIHYADTGPAGGTNVGIPAGGGGAPTTTTSPVKYGNRAMSVTTSATSNSGIAHDGYLDGMFFPSGQPFTLSVWLNCASGTFPYKVALSANKNDGTFEEATATGTVTAGVWTQVTLTLTPTADRSADSPDTDVSIFRFEAGMIWITITQTNSTARTFYVDGLRLIPGSSADDFEMTHWDIPAGAEDDIVLAHAEEAITGSTLAGLSQLNAVATSRHWVRAEMSSPWYSYVLEDRDTFAAKTVDETFSENVQDMSNLDFDREAVVNVVPVSYGTASKVQYVSDGTSVARFGARPSTAIAGANFLASASSAITIGSALVARYKLGPLRPQMTVENQFPSQVARDLSDLLDITVARFLLQHFQAVILAEHLTIADAGRYWKTVLDLEQYPY